MIRKLTGAVVFGVAALACGSLLMGQSGRPEGIMSPPGSSSAQVLGKWVPPAAGRRAFTLGGANYEGGKWIDITYGRPLRRGRDLFGRGATYGKDALVGAPIWRAGAEVTTRLKTEVPLQIGGAAGKTVPAGEYSVFIDLKEGAWTFVLSSLPFQPKYDPAEKTAVWGAYNYTPDKDVLRAPMKLESMPHSQEQLSWNFLDMTDTTGTLALSWGNTMADVAFAVGK